MIYIDELFNDIVPIDLSKAICHSGGAIGADTIWEEKSSIYGTIIKAYSYQTPYHKSVNKVEISEKDFMEGIDMINKANHTLNRYGISKYINLLARNWSQIKYSEQVFAIGRIISPGEKNSKNYYNQSKYEVVDGGTGYAVQMGINDNKEIYVFDMNRNDWYYWSVTTMKFVKCRTYPIITRYNFAGIGSREITEEGKNAICNVLLNTYKKFK